MNTLKRFMVVLNNADKYPTEHELAEVALAAKDKLNRLVEQRDAALKLADAMDLDSPTGRYFANKLRAIFETKDEK